MATTLEKAEYYETLANSIKKDRSRIRSLLRRANTLRSVAHVIDEWDRHYSIDGGPPVLPRHLWPDVDGRDYGSRLDLSIEEVREDIADGREELEPYRDTGCVAIHDGCCHDNQDIYYAPDFPYALTDQETLLVALSSDQDRPSTYVAT